MHIEPHPAYRSHKNIHRITVCILVLDALYILGYFLVTLLAIVQGNQTVETDGFLALGSPHSGIIPTLVAILANLRSTLRDNLAGKGTRMSADPGWFLIPYSRARRAI
jgi:hypothetical protein